MPVTPARARKLAISFPDTEDRPQFDRTAFRTPRKTFATLAGDGTDINLMFDHDQQEFCCAQSPAVSPVPGGWGRMGATRCDLKTVDEPTLASALNAAYRLALPKKKTK